MSSRKDYWQNYSYSITILDKSPKCGINVTRKTQYIRTQLTINYKYTTTKTTNSLVTRQNITGLSQACHHNTLGWPSYHQ